MARFISWEFISLINHFALVRNPYLSTCTLPLCKIFFHYKIILYYSLLAVVVGGLLALLLAFVVSEVGGLVLQVINSYEQRHENTCP